jgi:polyvinyl alcohol dehydrogenase (cytochrome)
MKSWQQFRAASAVLFLGIVFSCNQENKKKAPVNRPAPVVSVSATTLKSGEKLFVVNCAACHGSPSTNRKTPSLTALSAMEPNFILDALNKGKMQQQAKSLSEKDRQSVAEFLTRKNIQTITLPKQAYTTFSFSGNGDELHDVSGWGGNLEGTGFRTAQQAGIAKANVGRLQLKWSFAFPGGSEVRGKPAVVGDWVIIGSQSGEVYALNRETGKIGWVVRATTGIRGGIVIAKTGNYVTAYYRRGNIYLCRGCEERQNTVEQPGRGKPVVYLHRHPGCL